MAGHTAWLFKIQPPQGSQNGRGFSSSAPMDGLIVRKAGPGRPLGGMGADFGGMTWAKPGLWPRGLPW
jgi:hypothetical protein